MNLDNDVEDSPELEISDPYRSMVIREKTRIKTAVSNRRKTSQDRLRAASEVLGSKGTTDLTQNELSLFHQILTRGIDETKYRIVKEIASGGMGNIYCAYDEDIKRHSVLKIILPNYKDDLDIIKRFIFEARITGDLEHPNIISMHDFGFLPGYGIYFTMTYVRGESLFDIIKKLRDGDEAYWTKYNLYTLLNIFRKTCDAVAYAHSKGIIHRDIKPENIMVGKFGEVILMDWGLAKKLRECDSDDDLPIESETDTETKARTQEPVGADMPAAMAAPSDTTAGEIKGTPVYLSPEQASGDPALLDESTDVFLLGATLYHMFTFQAPYDGGPIQDVIKRAEKTDYVHPEEFSTKNAQLSTLLCSIINRAMAGDRNDRYESVEQLIGDVDELLHGKMEYRKKTFAGSEALLVEGEQGEDCYVIVDGEVEVYKDVGGQAVLLSTLTAGDIVGEMALITNEPRTASVIARTKTEVIVLTKEVFIHNLEKLPSWMEKAVSALATRLRDANQKYTDSVINNQNADTEE